MNEEELIRHCQREVKIAERIRRYDKHYLEHKLMLDVILENQKLKQKLQQRDNIIKKAREFVNEYEKNRNCFKWNEQDYIDTINEIKKILNIDKGE